MLGSSYGGGTGAELGRLVVYLAPWMVASVAVSVTFPLLFVRGRARWLPLLARRRARACRCRSSGRMREAFGLAGIAAGMAVTTGARARGAAAASLGALAADAARRRSSQRPSAAGSAAVAFARPERACSAPVPAAAVGLVALRRRCSLCWRPAGLRAAWAYARTLQ